MGDERIVRSTTGEAEDYAATVSGVLAVPLSQLPRDYLLFFRSEVDANPESGGRRSQQDIRNRPIGRSADAAQELRDLEGDRAAPVRSHGCKTSGDTAEAVRSALVEVVLRHNELLADERHKR